MTSRARLCAIAGALLSLGCSSPATPIDRKQIEAAGRAVKTPAGMGGHRFELVIGMDLLASRDWRMTFDEATWAFAPQR